MRRPTEIVHGRAGSRTKGYRVIRFWNSEITSDLTAVLERIHVELCGSREAETAPLKHRRT
ncbi:DUF559 domain-containing protein [Bradyrhizobium japonicum]|uniref:DUF559 domain-containing protein n=1 Tax=Bradyrhizobium japonicum TaxID=375 RepID=UPI0024C05325|nr:DUF559 domain-containing protein [Bradyrhizobium japonicum]